MDDKNGLEDVGRFSAEGYSFYTEKDAALAENEKRKVQYLEARMDYDHPESILRIYNKAIDERIFKSPVGHFFLKSLQDYLAKQPGIAKESIADIPMYVSFAEELRNTVKPAPKRPESRGTRSKPKEAGANGLMISMIINLVLAVAVIAMFVITLKTDQPNILNYEKAITNRYAAWEQELTEREKAVRVKERELNIEE
ncbi:MAG: hypothetical protein J6M66_05275 [Lachnospiraceae bacterium]|nr:hypothetical protein [Lachnospiraceae bacterium]